MVSREEQGERKATRAERSTGREAMGRLLEGCRTYLKGRARRLIPPAIGAKIGASDLVQEVFVDAARKPGEMPKERSDELRAWLYRIMTLNMAEKRRHFLGTARADVRREVRLETRARRPGGGTIQDRLADGGESPSGAAAAIEAQGRLADAIAGLPEVERRVIVLRYWERLDYAEIGRHLGGKSADAARMVHARACRRMLRELGGGST